jgi:pimeloyl-ACP methyl ester carboxylesterase
MRFFGTTSVISVQASDCRSWDYVREDFAKEFQVIVFDHRGHGFSAHLRSSRLP